MEDSQNGCTNKIFHKFMIDTVMPTNQMLKWGSGLMVQVPVFPRGVGIDVGAADKVGVAVLQSVGMRKSRLSSAAI